MDRMELAFLIWMLVGLFFVGNGVSCFFCKTEVGFWANVKTPKMDDVKGYNHAVGKMFIIYGIIMMFLGTPLLVSEQNSPLFLISVVGIMLETIVMMAVYIIKIEGKYKSRG
ncbi:MAG: hypothetical protein Q4F21_08730 [Lachnospiraceae bacterium]|nr:hypothetical protein [Lachnospiraceae bacterium]